MAVIHQLPLPINDKNPNFKFYMSPHIQALISLLETLPFHIQQQVVEHLQEYIQELKTHLETNQIQPETASQPAINYPENPQPRVEKTDYLSELSSEELEALNNCQEFPVWSPFES